MFEAQVHPSPSPDPVILGSEQLLVVDDLELVQTVLTPQFLNALLQLLVLLRQMFDPCLRLEEVSLVGGLLVHLILHNLRDIWDSLSTAEIEENIICAKNVLLFTIVAFFSVYTLHSKDINLTFFL